MDYRTDLALERDVLINKGKMGGEDYKKTVIQVDDDIRVVVIEILSERGKSIFGKPVGKYVTIEAEGVAEAQQAIKERVATALAVQLSQLIDFFPAMKVLVIGLGNEKVTPDSLGPHTVEKIKVTSHYFKMLNWDADMEVSQVSAFNPSVTGVTGMETADVVERLAALTEPDLVIIVDALAAMDIERLSTTIQISDTGISPGSGMGNHRKAIDSQTLGCRVISIGVPTVIDSATLLLRAAQTLKIDGIDEYIKEADMDMIVTSTDIDTIIKDFSEIIAEAINITLHPGIYS